MSNLIFQQAGFNSSLRDTANLVGSMAQLAQQQIIQAQAYNINGFVCRHDFLPVLGDYRRKNTILWQMLSKASTNLATIKEMLHTARPTVGFTDRNSLADAPQNPVGVLDKDLEDRGQDLKALTGFIDTDHFSHSLYEAQGVPYFEQYRTSTEEMLMQAFRVLEFALIDGDASTNPYQFNGFTRQMAPNHTFNASVNGATPDMIDDKLDEIIIRATTDVNTIRRISHIICSPPAYRQLQRQMKTRQQYFNVMTITPGVEVDAISTVHGRIPIYHSPYIKDVPGDPANNIPDKVVYWLLDMDTIKWYGLKPQAGGDGFDPQIFDVTHIVEKKPMLKRRFLLQYGTLYCSNRGQGIYKLEVEVPDGSLWNDE